MPLPNKVIARTIERIGYSCGEVSSTSAVDGSSGAYNVTCSSGRPTRRRRFTDAITSAARAADRRCRFLPARARL